MPDEYWNEGHETNVATPAGQGVLKSLVTLLGLVLALTLYMLPGEQRVWPIVLLAFGGGLIWLAYGFRSRSGSHSR